MKKRIFAGLLTLVMVFTLLPVSAMAEAGNWEQNLFNGFKSAYGTVVGTKSFTAATTFQTGKDGQLKVMPILEVPSGYTTITYNAMAYCGAKAASSNTDVVEVKQTDDGKQDICIGKWEGGDFHGADCLQVNVTPKKAGRAVVTISFYYTFSQSRNPFQNGGNTQWYKGTMKYTVNVTEPVAKPDQPDAGSYKGTYGNEGKFAIVLECDREKTHTYAYKSLKDVENGYTMGAVAVNDGSTGISTSKYPYICPMTINYAPWVNAVNAQFAKDGEHSLSGTAQSETIYWCYGTDGEWYTSDAAPVRISITCTEPNPKPDPKPDFEKENVNIRVQCIEYPSMHDPYKKSYGILPGAYTDNGVTEEEGTYVYTIELNRAKYIAQFDQDINKSHTDTAPNEKTYIEWRWENDAWHLIGGPDGVDADIKVKCSQTETPPKAPTADELKKLEMAVQVKCVVDDSQQHNDAYDLLGKCDVDYFVGEPRKDGDDWLCDISYDPDLYVAKFNTTFQNLKHVQNDEKIVPVTLIWAGDSWQLKTQGRVHVTEEYTVTFNAYGGFPTPDEQHVKSGEKAVLPVAPTLKGYTFAFWYLGEDEQNATAYDFDTPVTGDITLTAKWNINKYTVTFDSYGGTPVPPKQEVEYGFTATKPDDPTLKGHTFAFWYLGEDEQNATAYDFGTPVTENITLTAKWNINKYTVTFDTDGGTPVPPNQEVEYGLTATEPTTAPTKTGYTFDGWYLGDEKYGFSDAVEQNITLKAKWEAKQVVNVVIYRNGNFETPYKTVALDKQSKGTVINLGKLNISDYYTPNATGKYKFYGWYNDGAWNNYKKDPANAPDGLNSVTVNGWTNIIAMVYDYEKVAVKAVYDNDKTGAKDIFVGEALHGSPLKAYLESNNIALDQPGYTHTEWYNWDWYAWEDHAVSANAKVNGWTNVYVAYKAIPYGVTYSYHNSVPAEVIDTLPTDKGTYTVKDQVTVQIPTAKEVAVDGYKWTFKGWQLDGKDVKSEQVNMTVGGLHFEGIWEREALPAAEYPVTYEYVSGTEGADLPWNVIDSLPVNEDTYAESEKVTTAMKPDDMVFGEYTWKFQGWTLNGTAVAPNTQVPMAKGGLHFVGTWIRTSAQDEEYPVTYEYVSGTEGAALPGNVNDSLPVNKYTYAEGEKVTTAMKPDDVVFGEYTWKFQGWTLNGTAVAPNTQVLMAKGGLHFVGTWIRTSAQDEEYPVTYSYVSGTEGADLPWNVNDSLPVNKYTYAEGEKVTTAMKPDDVVFGEYTWKFQGWTLNGTAVAPNTQVPMAKGGLNFVGTWIRTSAQDEEYPVTYSYVSGVEGVELPEEVKATLPVNKDTYTIGQQVPTAAKPANVTVGDYIWSLKAWKLGDNEIVPNNSVPMVEGGLNFVGIWTREKATVIVTFDANGGTVAPTSKTITKGSTLTLPTPVLSGYSFDGWFTEKTGGTQVNAGATFDKDTTLYAHWTKKSSSGGGGSSSRDYDYTLRYVTNGGKSIASETKSKRWTKDYEDLPMPTRAGYRFDGWYYDSALKNEVTGDVKVNSRTVTLYAGWIGSSVPDSLNGEDHFAYVQGYADGTVRPNTPVTRAQVATILFRLLDESVRKEYLTENNTFTDVASNYWANTAISTMANMGVFKGRTADRFDPNAPITRGEFAAVCARFDDSKVKTTETYSDIDGYWAANEILRAAALGWVQGYQDGSYRPNNSITRAQVVTMINRVLCRMPEKNADLLKGMSSFTDCAEDDWCYLAIQEATNSHDYKTKSGSIHEKWTDLNTAPDWSRFEH